VTGRRLHPFQQLARAALGGVALARQTLGLAHPRRESIAQTLELGQREQMRTTRRRAGARSDRGAGGDTAARGRETVGRRRNVREAVGDDRGELTLEPGDLRLEGVARGTLGEWARRGPRILDRFLATIGGELLGRDHQRITFPTVCPATRPRTRPTPGDSTARAKVLPGALQHRTGHPQRLLEVQRGHAGDL
jgi:hypothetical protein